ncbi:MAG TPA: hypothetical protein VL551_11650 [Actinospica sp.]|nr:hypothetical protein [Actinospica sp.]
MQEPIKAGEPGVGGAQGWWGVLLQGTIASGVGGMVAAITAWAVVSVTHRHEHRFALRGEVRTSAIALFHLAGRIGAELEQARSDRDASLPSTGSQEWLVTATSVEIAAFSFDEALGARWSNSIGAVRAALESLNAGSAGQEQLIADADLAVRRLIDELADWLMQGRHRAQLNPSRP